MNRVDFQTLADERILDSHALLAASRWSGAYYLSGYAVECALKACIAKLTQQYDFPDKSFAQKAYTHNLDSLLMLAGLRKDLDDDSVLNQDLGVNWSKVKDWNEDTRYRQIDEAQARDLYGAIVDQDSGVMQWIIARW